MSPDHWSKLTWDTSFAGGYDLFDPIGYLDRKRDRAYKQRVIVTPATLNVCHVMGSWWKLNFSRKTQKHVFYALSFNIAYKIHFFLGGGGILVTLDTHAKKMNLPSIILGGRVHGKACWPIAY